MMFKKNINEPQNFLMSIIESAPYGIITIDLTGHITVANAQAVDILELEMSVEELIEMSILDVVVELPDLKKATKKSLSRGRRPFDLEEMHFREKFLTCRGRKVLDGIIITIADITSIKESETTALNSMLEGQEQERKRLAREIHDGIGPTLSTIKMNLANIEAEVEHVNQKLGARFKKSYQMIDEVASDIRSISHNLLPKVLIDFGLEDALQTMCEKLEETKHLEVDFISSGLKNRLDEVTELGLYRVCQELINNTLKHAKAKKITIQLITRSKDISLMYEDDGLGFSPELPSEGIGMLNIYNRVKALSGEVIIDSQLDKGMTATINAPIISK